MVRTGIGGRCSGLTVVEKPGLPLLFSVSSLYPVGSCISCVYLSFTQEEAMSTMLEADWRSFKGTYAP